MNDPIVLELRGHVPGKKNLYVPNKDGKGFHIDREVKAAIDRLAMQIPGQYRDLKLEHPDIDFNFTYRTANWDKDNAATTLLDLLVEYGVLFNDNIAHCNGRVSTNPAVRGEYDSATIVILPKSQTEVQAPRYAPRRRQKRSIPLMELQSPATGLDRFEEILEDEWER